MERRVFFRTALGATLAGAALGASPPTSAPNRAGGLQDMTPEVRRRSRFPNVMLRTHEDRLVRFYDDLLKDKTVLISFMYTACTDDCPLTTANLGRVQKLLSPRVGRDTFIYSITVDPEHDTPAVLEKYAKTVEAKPGWLFLTGGAEDIQGLRQHFGDNPTLEFTKSQHLNLLTYGIEPLERWGGCPALADPKWIARYLTWLDPTGERPTGWWPPGHGIPGKEDAIRG